MEKASFDALFNNYRSIAFFGICKNAGKTTALNFLIERLSKDYTLGITGIGRDGESTDVVTGTHKPTIFLPKNALAATISSLLADSTVTKEILSSSGIYSQLGEIIIIRAIEGGFIEIAGPSISSDLAGIKNNLFSFGAEKVLIDGAINRKSFVRLNVADAAVLCCGASFDRDMEVVIKETSHIVKMFSAPKAQIKMPVCKICAFDKDNNIIQSQNETLQELLQKKNVEKVFIDGALTDSKLLPLIRSNYKISDKTVIVTNPTKILLSSAVYDMFKLRGGRIEVMETLPIVAVTINPISAYGWNFDPLEFKKRIQAEISLPVFNLMETE